MRTLQACLTGLLFAGAALAGSSASHAHPVTVDGDPAEWLTRLPNANNVGLIARNPAGHGEYIWRDIATDTRTDLDMPEVVGDLVAFQVTGDATGLGFLVRRPSNANQVGAPIQVQIAIDIDRVDGSGQEFFAEFADTLVASRARWERLVETLFGSGGAAKVIDEDFNTVEMAQAQPGAAGVIEMFVPWSALGLAGPPATPLRFTVATFRAKNTDVTFDIGGSASSNAVDVITDHGNPQASMYPNTFAEVMDQVVDYSFDVYFAPSGEVYAPLVIQRFLQNASLNASDEWYVVKNMTPDALPLAGFKLGDEETPDNTEGMFSFPDAAVLGAGETFTVARGGALYQTYFGAPPDAELPPGSGMAVPDMVPFLPWTNGVAGTILLGNLGDELVVLDPSNTVLDVAVYGTGTYSGIASFTPAPGLDEVATRNAASNDTDSCQVDFSNAGKQCITDVQCGSACKQCVGGACQAKAQGTACADADPCNGDEICNGMGACVTSPIAACDDLNPCTTDSCAPATGCAHENVAAGVSCSDGSVCNGAEVCDAAGACLPGTSLDCDDDDPCTTDTCDPAAGCDSELAPAGTDCSDGDACNGAETCDAAGACLAGTPVDCDDDNPCTVDSCDAAGLCEHEKVADDTACGDGDACNGDELCAAGVCTAGEPLDCDDQNDCTADTCEADGGCAHTNAAEGSPCDDGDSCAEPDACDDSGACVPGACGGAGGGGNGGGGTGGTGGAGGTTTTTTGEGATAGSGGGGTGGNVDGGGCGCRVADTDDRTSDLAWLATIALTAAFLRRRRAAA